MQNQESGVTQHEQEATIKNSYTSKKVLLVDDVELFLQLEKTFLMRKGYVEILTAHDGIEALEIVEDQQPDLIFMDFYMPKMNGDDCCRIIKKGTESKHIPVIMVTHGGREEDLERCWEAGCDGIITKPINKALFLSLAMKHLDLPVRSEPRYSAKIKVLHGPDGSDVLTDYSVNLSTGGLFLSTSRILPVDTRLVVQFELPSQATPVKCNARVAWINDVETPRKQELPAGMGLQFVDLKLSDMDIIRDYISGNALTADW